MAASLFLYNILRTLGPQDLIRLREVGVFIFSLSLCFLHVCACAVLESRFLMRR